MTNPANPHSPKKGLLIVLSGPSGVGKDTVLSLYLQQEQNCTLSVSATTRAPRANEADGRDYHFISREQFGELVAKGEMLEYAQYGDNLYGTPKSVVEQQLATGKNIILEIEAQGAMQVKKLRPDAVFVFIMPPSWEALCQRLQNRGTETAESLAQRLDAAKLEMRGAKDYDYILINDDIQTCSRNLATVITAAGFSNQNMMKFVEEVSLHA